jgi:hypothetical protein
MTKETLRWKLFTFSLIGKAKQWYTFAVESMNGISSLPRAILDIEQHEESIGAGLGSQCYYMPVQTCHYLIA